MNWNIKFLIKNIEMKNGKKVKKRGYVLKKDDSRNKYVLKDLSINSDIPAQYYEIAIIEDTERNFASIYLVSYAENDSSTNEKLYKDIEITKYMLDWPIINK